jgi:DNA-binding GntR family transcriptional regulator
VVGLDENSTRDHYDLLGRFYGYGAHRAAERATPGQTSVLAAVHRELQATNDVHAFSQLNLVFMRRLVSVATSRRVSATVRLMAVSIVPGDSFAGVPEAIVIHKRHLQLVMRSIEDGDGEGAERELVSMLRQEADLVVALLARRGVTGEPDAG